MRFYKLDEVPVSGDDKVFKVSPMGNGVAALIMYGITILALFHALGGLPSFRFPATLCYWIAGALGLFGLIPLSNFRASLKPSNWLMRCNQTGIFIKYRAYENWKLPGDKPQAVGLEYGEIAWAKIIKERRSVPAMNQQNRTELHFFTYLALGLAKPDMSALDAHLEADRNLRPDGTMVTLDYPVQTAPECVVEIRWNGIHPSASKALAMLGQRVRILEPEHRKVDLTYHRNRKDLTAPTEDETAKILALAKSGDEIGAVNLARQVYGCSMSEATERVDKLLGREE